MSWIREEEGLQLSNIIKVMSIQPNGMQAVQNTNAAVMFGGSALTRVQEEAIATTVAVINKCRF